MSDIDLKPRIVAKVPQFKIKYKDVFSLKNLYVMMHELLWEEGWRGYEGDRWHADVETLYSENIFQKGIHMGGKELWAWWRLQKNIEGKPNGYFKYLLDIDFHGVGLNDVEVMHQGKKIKVVKGECEIMFRPKLEGDHTTAWRNHWLLKNFQDIYEKRILGAEVEKFEKHLWRETYKISAKVKDFLNEKIFVPVPEPFHPKMYGWEAEP
ncbi:hypothetical protein ISS05_05800 [Candidatus Woesearchaeota archaeon]|nr:hypothetical protein [Candidatus Woesearchaeota archaeon]